MTKQATYGDTPLPTLSPKDFIIVEGSRVNNLKNLSVAIPRNKLVVITGLSGSGKSSLAFNTLYAAGQRAYAESLNAYARQFLGVLEKPDVDRIRGMCPAIAIEQRVEARNPRSTVGTTTEVYDYMKLLFARVGKTHAPDSGKIVTKDTVDSVVNKLCTLKKGTRIMVSCPLDLAGEKQLNEPLELLRRKGYVRILINGKPLILEECLDEVMLWQPDTSYALLIDRLVVLSDDEEFTSRLADSVEIAFAESRGSCHVYVEQGKTLCFSNRFECDGRTFVEPSVKFFGFNNSYGACRTCDGLGNVIGIDETLVIPDKNRSIADGAIAPWRGSMKEKWLGPLIANTSTVDFPLFKSYKTLTSSQQDMIWNGHGAYKGIHAFFDFLRKKTHKIQYRVLLSRYRGKKVCPSCKGTRIREDAGYVKVGGKSIIELLKQSIQQLYTFFDALQLSPQESAIAMRILTEIRSRLHYLCDVGLPYLTLSRLISTLSGGEYQRIKMATALGSSLVGSLYVIDEPSIGLHPRDSECMIKILCALRDLGNTVIVVEHEEAMMKAADEIIDIGPDAGTQGGRLVYQGMWQKLHEATHSYTAAYLTGKKSIVTTPRRHRTGVITLHGVYEHNLKNITVQFPLNVMTVVTGVSGSGKSTLVSNVLYKILSNIKESDKSISGCFESIQGDIDHISQVEFISQSPIGKSSRSNPVSYVKAYDHIRELYASQPLSVQRNYKPSHFSFNVDGGRCDQCLGEGEIRIEMQFMPALMLKCEHCNGKRFKDDILAVKYRDKNIAEVLDMTLDEGVDFFSEKKSIRDRLMPLCHVGMGYVRLGQSSNSLSGGEAQRVKLASFLVKKSTKKNEPILFIFDEPTTGLHFHDINKLLQALQALLEAGHSLVIIEHNMEIIKSADWIIDLGPEGGDEKGGNVVFEGTLEEMVRTGIGHTASYLKAKPSANIAVTS